MISSLPKQKSIQKTIICHSEGREESLVLAAEIRNEATLRSE
jgi:hypothetical protein